MMSAIPHVRCAHHHDLSSQIVAVGRNMRDTSLQAVNADVLKLKVKGKLVFKLKVKDRHAM